MRMRLIGATSLPTGVVALRYQPVAAMGAAASGARYQ